jgi:filamentous hemagglutinin family protein
MKPEFYLSFLTLISLVVSSQTVEAQTYQPSNRTPVADNTLGTQVSGSGNNFTITGGVNKGQTLFHSFNDFSVPTNGQANFLNPVGNRDIITRVTGGIFSDINGLVNTNGANFFLINPNGIVFGTNATLNIGKAFVGSTANSIDLVDGGGRTITFGTNANGDAPLLSVAPNVLFNVSRLNMGGGSGAISNFGTLQTNNNSQYIGLIGGNVNLNGGKIIAPGGRVDIGGLSGAGSVSVDNNGLVFSNSGLGRSNVLLTDDAGIIVRATGTLDTVNTFFNNVTANGSSINISAKNLDVLNSGAKMNNQPAALDAGLEVNSGLQTKAAGDININATGKVSINNAVIKNTLRSGSEGNIGGIKIQAGTLDIKNNSAISSQTSGRGNAGNIDLKTSGGINLINNSLIASDNSEQTAPGNAGDINIKATGDIKVSGYDVLSTNPTSSFISSSTAGQGNTGEITIDTQGKLSVVNDGNISSKVSKTAVGNGQGIKISARELEVANQSYISTITSQNTQVNGKGNAGDIDIKTTGDIQVSGFNSPSNTPTLSYISSDTQGYGDTGQVTIDTQGKLSVVNFGNISSSIAQLAVGNSKGLNITAREIKLANNSSIDTILLPNSQGNAGDIKIATTGDIQISGYEPDSIYSNKSDSAFISSSTVGQGDAGKITIDTQGKFSLSNGSAILNRVYKQANGNGRDISIAAREIELNNQSFILSGTDQVVQVNSNGKSGDIILQAKDTISLKNTSGISTNSSGAGQTGNVSITGAQLLLTDNSGFLSSATSVSGGNVTILLSDKLLLRNVSFITTSSGSRDKNGSGGNITISSPLIIALPGNNDIIANAYQGTGGKVNIISQGLFGIQDRPIGSDFTSDITASSQFGQSGTVDVDTPGTDPGRDTTELPNATTDASNQIDRVCSASTSQNKLTVTGRGGLPPNANDPLTSDVVWQDARANTSQPAVSSVPTTKLTPPAVGWVFDGKGKVTLVAAGTQGQPTGTRVVCPNVK